MGRESWVGFGWVWLSMGMWGVYDCFLGGGWSIWNQFGTEGRRIFFDAGLDAWFFIGLMAFGAAEARLSVAAAAMF